MAKKATTKSAGTSTKIGSEEQQKDAPIKDAAYPDGNVEYTKDDEAGRKLIFMAMIRNAYDQYLSTGTFTVEYYDQRQQRWLSLVSGIRVNHGKLRAEYVLMAGGSPTSETAMVILRVLEAGSFPMLRLITTASAKSQWTEVLAFGGLLSPSTENPSDLMLDFGGLWQCLHAGQRIAQH